MSVPIPGDFSCALAQTVQLQITALWRDGGANIRSSYVSEADAAAQLLREQTATFAVLQDATRKRTVKGYWVDWCPDETAECPTDYCELTGTETGASCQDYDITQCVASQVYSITEEMFDTSDLRWDNVFIPMMLRMKLDVENKLANEVLVGLRDNGSSNIYAGPYTLNGDVIEIPPSGWNPTMFAYLNTIFRKNRLSGAPVMIGSEFLEPMWNLTASGASTPQGAVDQRRLNAWGTPVFDVFQYATVFGAQGLTIYNPSALALVTRSEFARYGASGYEIPGANGQYMRRYTTPSLNLPGVTIDIIYQRECVGLDIRHSWQAFIHYDVLFNPKGCNTDLTGIINFQCAS